MPEKCRIQAKTRSLYGKAILWCAVLSFGCLLGASLANTANAQLDESQVVVGETAEAAGLAQTTTDLPTIIGRLIYIALSTVGIIFLALLLYSGYQYMTAGGDPDKIKSNLISQLTAPVKWTQIMQNMISNGIDSFVEVGGNGTVLSGFLKRIDRNIPVTSI